MKIITSKFGVYQNLTYLCNINYLKPQPTTEMKRYKNKLTAKPAILASQLPFITHTENGFEVINLRFDATGNFIFGERMESVTINNRAFVPETWMANGECAGGNRPANRLRVNG